MRPGGRLSKSGGNDIGYNHAVCPHGFAFTLRGFGVQSGANGDAQSNRDYAALVYMGGTGDRPTKEALPLLAEILRMWQEQGAGPLVKPHKFFTGSECPGEHLIKWLDAKPTPWAGDDVFVHTVEDETPGWLLDFIVWRLVRRRSEAASEERAEAGSGVGLGGGGAHRPAGESAGAAGVVPRLGGVAP